MFRVFPEFALDLSVVLFACSLENMTTCPEGRMPFISGILLFYIKPLPHKGEPYSETGQLDVFSAYIMLSGAYRTWT